VTWPEPELDDAPEDELKPEPDLCELDEWPAELDLCVAEPELPELELPDPDEEVPREVECCAAWPCVPDEAWALAVPGST
jgi:hypothetical protein